MPVNSTAPLVTVAIPLYRSRRFLDVITDNIRRADYPNLEILIGDRHLADDTVEQLRARFPDDSRLRFITARDGLSWVEHYNLLLTEGSGEYFLWMPHDDSYPPGYIGGLVGRLEAKPEAVLAFGVCDSEDADGSPRAASPLPPISREEEWSARSALRLYFGWSIGTAMRGVFRRAAVLDAELWLPRTTGGAYADNCWLFGLALLGRFEFIPETRCLKRFYPESTHAQWNGPVAGELPRIMTRYLRTFVPSKPQRFAAIAILWFGAAVNRGSETLNRLARRTVISEGARRGAFRWLLGVRGSH